MQPMSLSSAARFATGAAMAQQQDADLMVTAQQAMAHPSCTARSVFQCKACPRRVFRATCAGSFGGVRAALYDWRLPLGTPE